MKKLFAAFMLFAAISCISCSEEGFTKVFECYEEYPYFSTKTHLCYQTEQAREDAENKLAQEEENAQSEE